MSNDATLMNLGEGFQASGVTLISFHAQGGRGKVKVNWGHGHTL